MVCVSSKVIVAFGTQKALGCIFRQTPVENESLRTAVDLNLLWASFPVSIFQVFIFFTFFPVFTTASTPVQSCWAKMLFDSEYISGHC